MPYVPAKGKTLLIPSGTHKDPDKKHLYVILTNSCPKGQHLLVPVCSIVPRRYHDPSCEIEPGEHEFINHKSYVEYRFCSNMNSEHITTCVDGWVYNARPDMGPALLERVCDGVEASTEIPMWAREYFIRWRDR